MTKEIEKAIANAKAMIEGVDNAPKAEPVRPAKLHLELVDYSDRAFAIVGDTKWVSAEIRALGIAKFSSHLSVNGRRTSGWVFSKKYEEIVRNFIIILTK